MPLLCFKWCPHYALKEALLMLNIPGRRGVHQQPWQARPYCWDHLRIPGAEMELTKVLSIHNILVCHYIHHILSNDIFFRRSLLASSITCPRVPSTWWVEISWVLSLNIFSKNLLCTRLATLTRLWRRLRSCSPRPPPTKNFKLLPHLGLLKQL